VSGQEKSDLDALFVAAKIVVAITIFQVALFVALLEFARFS